MPLIYRAMTPDGDKPKIGPTARSLGVRPGADIKPDENGFVTPGTGGMSVAPSWRELKKHRIPRRLRNIVPGATGSNLDRCWRMGEGGFKNDSVATNLTLRPDREDHGMVEPSVDMLLADFQAALGATQAEWSIDED
jgi:hypothetical protein